MNTLESIQYQAALGVTGAWKGTNRDKIYEELGWESLHNRRYFRPVTVLGYAGPRAIPSVRGPGRGIS